jgi:hypothetical protein
VKLTASLGLVLAWGGWSELFVGPLAGALLGAVYAQAASARRGTGGRVYVPLGSFLLLGAFAAIALLRLRQLGRTRAVPLPRVAAVPLSAARGLAGFRDGGGHEGLVHRREQLGQGRPAVLLGAQ